MPQAAGSATDTVARILGAALAEEIGQQIIVDDRPGGALTVGLDLTAAMLKVGQQNISQAHQIRRVQLVNGRAEALPFPDAVFDALTFTYLFRYVEDPQATLEELARVVRPGGVVASLEFMVPPNAFWRAWWWGYTRFVLPVAGLATGGPEWYLSLIHI